MNIVHVLDTLRAEKNIPIYKFVEDVCNRRSYYLYRDENKEIPASILEKLCNKLNISLVELFTVYH